MSSYTNIHESDTGSLVEFAGEIYATVGDRSYTTQPAETAPDTGWPTWQSTSQTFEHGMPAEGVVERYCHHAEPEVETSELRERVNTALLSTEVV